MKAYSFTDERKHLPRHPWPIEGMRVSSRRQRSPIAWFLTLLYPDATITVLLIGYVLIDFTLLLGNFFSAGDNKRKRSIGHATRPKFCVTYLKVDPGFSL